MEKKAKLGDAGESQAAASPRGGAQTLPSPGGQRPGADASQRMDRAQDDALQRALAAKEATAADWGEAPACGMSSAGVASTRSLNVLDVGRGRGVSGAPADEWEDYDWKAEVENQYKYV